MALMKAPPCEDIIPSYVGGSLERSFHIRTVASRDAERTRSAVGKMTPRTWRQRVSIKPQSSRIYTIAHIILMPL